MATDRRRRALHDHLGRLPRRRQPRRLPRVPRPGVPRGLRRLAGQVQEPVQGPRRQPAPAQLGQRDAQLASRRPTASSARWCSPTRCRRSSRASCCSPSRPPTRSTRTATPACRPTTAGWSTGATSSPSAAPASARSSSTTSTTPSRTCSWIKEHGLRGGILLPNIAARREVGEAALRPRATTALWEVLPGPRDPGQRAQRHRQPGLRAVPRRRCCSTSTRSPSTRSARSCR